jgi:hypothetical protein
MIISINFIKVNGLGSENVVPLDGFDHQKDIFGLAINCAHSYNVATSEERPQNRSQ